ncbi:heme o synthase [Acidicapsa dinghuensis]|uniref:Protoheme IX farnesyltransferase n=1 Tax=Acidicapsa dinghuensis TaxID=2218256 RepID=A0ABW1EG61_9BACT|nr:heme o synthase [Acidicapsa dinghuensis]
MSTLPSATAKAPVGVSAHAHEPAETAHASLAFHPAPGATATFIGDLRELFKFKVTAMVLITTWAGFYLGSLDSGISSIQRGLLNTLIGVGLASAGSSALNEALERKSDAKMIRTANRPIASGRFSLAQGAILGLIAVVLSGVWLLNTTNPLTAGLTLLTVFSYVAIYTPLKRVTTLATFLGAFPGAAGPLLGWTASRGQIEWPGIALFAILFVWQFPHFMAIAWLYRHDYGRAGIKMLPVVQPDGLSTVIEALFYAVLMIPVSLAPWYLHMAGIPYAIYATVLGLVYLGYTIRFARILRARSETESRMFARDLLKVSVIYLPLLLTGLMLAATVRHP